MMPQKISRRVVADRLAWISSMLTNIRALPLASRDEFFSDPRNIFAAESCLRRALEALFDLGRHILAKGFSVGVSEYKEIARALYQNGIINAEESALLNILAGYRNRLVHFYHEVSPDELYEICTHQLGDISRIANALQGWINAHPDDLDDHL